ncbi:GNAT family N-acetyltransferase [Cellulomonas sp. URHE0023]|uniref:GNAT family N-acetyltransferase n=1 Tax=Cellulomonas sp. URHE0023 TaxID=1380354 RepID=UPI0009E03267|nr:GNAT family N-acetyltransferase [Cellulomonas sp. URHE0023]
MIESDAIAGRDVRHPDRIPLVPSGGLTAVRIGVQVRGAQPGDLDSLVALVLTARQEAGVGSQLCTDDSARLHDQLGTLLGVEGGRILLAQLDGEPAGLMLARIVGPGPFTDVVAMDIEAVYVQPDARRRGLGRALLLAAVAVAEEAGATELYSSPLPGARGMQRFLARIGFAPAASHRAVSTAVLQRRLAQDHAPSTTRRLEDLIARRRHVREARRAPDDVPSPVARASSADQSRASITMHVNRAVQSNRPPSSSTTTW